MCVELRDVLWHFLNKIVDNYVCAIVGRGDSLRLPLAACRLPFTIYHG